MNTQEQTRKIKLLKMWEILKSETDEEHPIKTNDLIARLKKEGIDVDRKILYKDIELLNLYGYEVLKDRRRSNAYYVEDRSFDVAEVRFLIDTVKASGSITEKKTEELINKLSVLAGSKRGQLLKEKITRYSTVKGTNESIYYSVDTIVRAIKENKKIGFNYSDYGVNRERIYRLDKEDGDKKRWYIVNPVVTFIDNDQYYLTCYDDNHEGKLANYRIDRMDRVAMLDEDITPNPTVDIGKHKRQQVGMYSGETKEVSFEIVGKGMVDVVFDKFGDNVKMHRLDHEKIKCIVSVQVSPVFVGWCLSFGEKLKVISPPSTLIEIKKHLSSLAEQYEE